MEGLTLGILWNAPQTTLLKSHTIGNLWAARPRDAIWNASQVESFGRYHRGVLLERLTIGVIWITLRKGFSKASQREPFGHNSKGALRESLTWNPLETTPRDSVGTNQRDGCYLERITRGILRKVPQRGSIGAPHYRNHLDNATKWVLLKSLTTGTIWTYPQRDSTGKPKTWNHLETTPRDSVGTHHIWNPLDGATNGSCWKASQLESFGKGYKRILLEGLAIGILRDPIQTGVFLWKVSQQGSTGQHPKGIPRESLTTGILRKALQSLPHSKRILLGGWRWNTKKCVLPPPSSASSSSASSSSSYPSSSSSSPSPSPSEGMQELWEHQNN